jgi:hypothetical protein
MSHYFFHLRSQVDDLRDAEGLDFVDLNAVKNAMLEAARDIMVGDLRTGTIDLRYRIDAEDDGGAIVLSLPFEHAVNIIPPQ